jgi:uncharacterized protein YigE (DUF2233 family)
LLVLLFGLLGSCEKANSAPPAQQSFCHQQVFEGARFSVCDAKGGQLQLFAASRREAPIRSFSELATKVDPNKVAFAMNAGMFDENGRPIGMATVRGESKHDINLRDGGGNFHLRPNGVFMILCGGSAAIFISSEIPLFRCAPRLVTQSGPMLVIAGKLHPQIAADGTSRNIRNGVGVRDGKPLFVISEDPVSFGKFARFFRDALKTPNALYFDGVVSSLWDPAAARQDSHSPLGPIVVAFKPGPQRPRPQRPNRH